MKKLIIIAIVAVAAIVSFARPFHGPVGRRGPMHHAPPPPPAYHHHHHHVGRTFWKGVGVGLVGGLLAPAPTIVSTPVVVGPVVGRTWVPATYELRPVYDQFGNVLRYE